MEGQHRPTSIWFRARCGRTEYWLFAGALTAIALVASSWPAIACLAFGVGLWLLAARRLHDLGRSGWWAALLPATQVLAALALGTTNIAAETILGVASVATLASVVGLGALPGEPNANRFGPVPTPPLLRDLFG